MIAKIAQDRACAFIGTDSELEKNSHFNLILEQHVF